MGSRFRRSGRAAEHSAASPALARFLIAPSGSNTGSGSSSSKSIRLSRCRCCGVGPPDNFPAIGQRVVLVPFLWPNGSTTDDRGRGPFGKIRDDDARTNRVDVASSLPINRAKTTSGPSRSIN